MASALLDALDVMGQLIGCIKSWFTQTKESLSRGRLIHSQPILLILRVIREIIRDDATHLAAGISYFAIFSLFPILLGSLAVLGMALISVDTREVFLRFVAEHLPGSEEFIAAVLPVVRHNVDSLATFSGLFGLVALAGMSGPLLESRQL